MGRPIAAVLLLVLAAGCAALRSPDDNLLRDADAALARGDTAKALRLLQTRARGAACTPEEFVRLGRIGRSGRSVLDRLYSQRLLEEGVRRFPDDPNVLVELAKTYYEQTFYGDAERVFARVLSIVPDHCEAHYYLGANAYRKWNHVQEYTDYLTAAVDHLDRAVACAPEDADAFIKLAFSRYVLGDTTLVVDVCEKFRRRHPDAPEPLLLLGCVAWGSARYDACQGFFREALALMPEDERKRYEDIGLLLPIDERARYDEATPEERLEVERLYWLDHDLDPTTEIDERYLEHLCRVFIADQRFRSITPSLRGWETDRGRAMIKFGWPDQLRTTLRGIRPWDGRTEIWTYSGFPKGFDLWFRDEYLNGNYIVPLEDEVSAGTLYYEPALTDVVPDAAPLTGSVDVVTFRDSDDSSTVCLAYTADGDSLSKYLWTWDIGTFFLRTAFFEEDGRFCARYADTLCADSLPGLTPQGGRSVQVLARYVVPFNSYRVVLCFEDQNGLTRSLVWSYVNTLRYLDNSLVLSDILFHTPRPTAGGQSIHRRGKPFFPKSGKKFARSEELQLYVELYNLRSTTNESRYEVTLSIYAADTASSRWDTIGRGIKRVLRRPTEAPVISQSFHRTGAAEVASEDLAIDIDALEPGNYILDVDVMDEASEERASASKPFTKLARTVN